jgi:hypothetical protein
MKKILLLSFAMFCSVFAGCQTNSGHKFYDSAPTEYNYQYSGTMAYPIVPYQVSIQEKDGTVALSYSEDGPDVTIYRAPADLLQKIGEKVRAHKLYNLKNHYEPSFEILDGYGWSVGFVYEDGYIFSGGSNAWPDGKLWAGITEINEMLQAIVDNAAPEDIIGTGSLRQ